MRQRAALLRTFLAGREVILLDEPFGALDSLTRAGMQQWLVQVWEEFLLAGAGNRPRELGIPGGQAV
jgi:ABC-type nitrate/sulfonate/bicarbonate transport system ATPase subunit